MHTRIKLTPHEVRTTFWVSTLTEKVVHPQLPGYYMYGEEHSIIGGIHSITSGIHYLLGGIHSITGGIHYLLGGIHSITGGIHYLLGVKHYYTTINSKITLKKHFIN